MTIAGGPVFWILVVLAVAAIVVFLERLVEFRRSQIDCLDFVRGVVNVLGRDNEEEALSICDETSVPVAAVVATAVRHRKSGDRALREAVNASCRAETGRLERRLAALSIMGHIAPALGLLGTIIGFIRAVLLMNGPGGEIVSRPELMDAAMEALVSAALGLAVAIPIAVMNGSLRVRLDRLSVELEAAANEIIGYLADPGKK